MPVMELLPEEVNDLAAYLSSLGKPESELPAEAFSDADLRSGARVGGVSALRAVP